jgi:hypothetical protein
MQFQRGSTLTVCLTLGHKATDRPACWVRRILTAEFRPDAGTCWDEREEVLRLEDL